MKLQRVYTREEAGTKYYKFVLNPPKSIIDALGWSEGQEVTVTVEGGAMVIRATRN